MRDQGNISSKDELKSSFIYSVNGATVYDTSIDGIESWISGSILTPKSSITTSNGLIINNTNDEDILYTWDSCGFEAQSITLPPKTEYSLCAINNSVSTTSPQSYIVLIGLCHK
jgi:hypothetical protein